MSDEDPLGTRRSGPVCIHLGCGRRYIPGWIHVDVDDHPHVDHRHVAERLPMFPDDSADVIYASHFFAYYDRQQALDALIEWKRVLKPGGVLRLSTPDFAKVVELYEANRNLDLFQGFLYGRYVTADGPVFYRTTYDEASLTRLLGKAGFREVRRYDWRDTVHASVDDYSQAYLPHMDKENGTMMSLNLEATK